MRLWHFLSSVNSFFKRTYAAIQLGLDVCFWSDPSSTSLLHECEQQRLWRDCADAQADLACAGRLCGKYHNLMSWLITLFPQCWLDLRICSCERAQDNLQNKLPHDKTNKMTVRPAKTHISLSIHPVWSVFNVCMKKVCPYYPYSKNWSDWADLSLRWVHR